MGIGFNWFEKYKILHYGNESDHYYDWPNLCDWYKLKYLDGGSTSHSARNVIESQNLIEKYSGKRIPSIAEECIDSVDYDLDLIEPDEMVQICNKILSDTECDKCGMRDRIELFKQLSEDGYYLTYNYA